MWMVVCSNSPWSHSILYTLAITIRNFTLFSVAGGGMRPCPVWNRAQRGPAVVPLSSSSSSSWAGRFLVLVFIGGRSARRGVRAPFKVIAWRPRVCTVCRGKFTLQVFFGRFRTKSTQVYRNRHYCPLWCIFQFCDMKIQFAQQQFLNKTAILEFNQNFTICFIFNV